MVTAKEIMHQHTFVPAGMPINEVAALMTEKKIGSVLIKTAKGLGILTERDINGKVVAKAKDPKKLKAEDVMTFPAKTIAPNTDIYQICAIFTENRFRRLPVVDNGEVLGVLTTRDVVKQFVPPLIRETYHFQDFRF